MYPTGLKESIWMPMPGLLRYWDRTTNFFFYYVPFNLLLVVRPRNREPSTVYYGGKPFVDCLRSVTTGTIL